MQLNFRLIERRLLLTTSLFVARLSAIVDLNHTILIADELYFECLFLISFITIRTEYPSRKVITIFQTFLSFNKLSFIYTHFYY